MTQLESPRVVSDIINVPTLTHLRRVSDPFMQTLSRPDPPRPTPVSGARSYVSTSVQYFHAVTSRHDFDQTPPTRSTCRNRQTAKSPPRGSLAWAVSQHTDAGTNTKAATVKCCNALQLCGRLSWTIKISQHPAYSYIEPCFGTGLSLSLTCQTTSEDIKQRNNNSLSL